MSEVKLKLKGLDDAWMQQCRKDKISHETVDPFRAHLFEAGYRAGMIQGDSVGYERGVHQGINASIAAIRRWRDLLKLQGDPPCDGGRLDAAGC